jgi:hypothetical protein
MEGISLSSVCQAKTVPGGRYERRTAGQAEAAGASVELAFQRALWCKMRLVGPSAPSLRLW